MPAGRPLLVERVHADATARLATRHGVFEAHGYRDAATGAEHVALVARPFLGSAPLVRVHSECVTGESFGSLHCDCGPQLDESLRRVQADGGAVVYLRGQEGRGIGLVDKLRAYALQADGLDTLDANLALGLPPDAREYGAAAAILADLGLGRVRLLTNNPEKIAALTAAGVEVVAREPLEVAAGPRAAAYLSAKRDRMGHLLAGQDDPRGSGGPGRHPEG